MKETNGIVYVYTNKMNNKKYIGATLNEKLRITKHKCVSGENTYFHKCMQSEGTDLTAFEYAVLYRVTGWDLGLVSKVIGLMEDYYIELYDTTNPEYGYNKQRGGYGIRVMSEETKLKLRNINKGKHLSDEQKCKISKALASVKGRKVMCIEKDCVYDTIASAAEEVNGNKHALSAKLNKQAKNGEIIAYRGMHWKFA
jgi:hypothetical protein